MHGRRLLGQQVARALRHPQQARQPQCERQHAPPRREHGRRARPGLHYWINGLPVRDKGLPDLAAGEGQQALGWV
eukprot:scaffold14770_cov31-Prasinocladus_malaysianus.AAC.1